MTAFFVSVLLFSVGVVTGLGTLMWAIVCMGEGADGRMDAHKALLGMIVSLFIPCIAVATVVSVLHWWKHTTSPLVEAVQ